MKDLEEILEGVWYDGRYEAGDPEAEGTPISREEALTAIEAEIVRARLAEVKYLYGNGKKVKAFDYVFLGRIKELTKSLDKGE